MSNDTQEPVEMGTRPLPEHQWLQKLVGDWKCVAEMSMGPGEPAHTSEGTETCRSLGGLWAFAEAKATMPDGSLMEHYATLGYDVTFKEYRGCWFASMSSHLWKQTGTLSEDGKTMTLDCVGPDMEKDGETANYRDVIEILDDDHRTLTSYVEDGGGQWQKMMTITYTRV